MRTLAHDTGYGMAVDRRWEHYWLKRAHLNASMSTCMSRQVGAVAVLDRHSFADAYNGTPAGERNCNDDGCERCQSHVLPGTELDDCKCVHSEANIVAYCAKRGIALDGATVYCTAAPCGTCAKLLVSAGVVEVVYEDSYPASPWVFNLKHLVVRKFAL